MLMSKLMQQSRPALVSAAAGVALAGALGIAGTASAAPLSGAERDAGMARTLGAAGPTHASPGSRFTPGAGTGFSDWPMFHADPGHSGVSPETAISTMTAPSLTTRWTARLGTPSYTSPAVATSGGRALVYAGAGNHFYAYPAGGGAAVWSYTLPAGVVENSPAVADGAVYFGSTAGTIYALNASTGARMCSFSTGQAILASPVVVDNGSGPVVYDGTVPSGVSGAEYAINGPGNTHGACTKDWEFNSWAVTPGGTWSSPAYGMGANRVPLLVFGSKDRDDSVYALNANTGALVWRYQTSSLEFSDVGAPPTVSPRGRNGFTDGVVYVTGKDKVVYALNLATGKLIWKFRLDTGTNGDLAGAALVGDRIYVGTDTGAYALNATTGALVWHVLSQATFYGSPAVTGPIGRQVLVAASTEGSIYALSLATGATLWTQKPDNSGFWGSPAVSQGGFYIAGLDGVLRDFAPRS
jgi:eukaryotic-like serine/threonine-protein kinase